MSRTGWAHYEAESHMDMRRPLWQTLQDALNVERVLYPGCYVDVSPSFVFPHVTYVDTDRRCPAFFADPEVARRLPNAFIFLHQDYRKPFEVSPVDLLISQYAGPISHYCKGYVRRGGYLLANNSHADAGIAALDPDWALVGVLRGDRLVETGLDDYFQPKPGRVADKEQMIQTQKGIAYTTTASNYIFRRKGDYFPGN